MLADMTNLTLRVPTKLKRALASAGRRQRRTQSDIAREAIAGFLHGQRVRTRDTGAIPMRPAGYFNFDDELTDLANRAEPSFTLADEN
ncbi:MAG: hypothetical protein HZA93_13340 [Verrucomicrobia bacterium]|nr:hypothetical protein [Verrucomicrobiota bacterium]